MSQPCGCCAGIQVVTPQTEANPPGMSALKYRVGTYATFYESMLARLSTLCLNVPSTDGSAALRPVYPLRQLTTRDPSDPSIAMLDAWAVVGDVLTFYQERIANEGYLATATERRSLLELARLVNYTLRPGASASVYLAFTVQKGFSGTIPAGTRAQSVPGSGQMPQFFETSNDLDVRDAWNDLGVRLTRPQVITLASDPGTDAASRKTLYFDGISTNLKTGDALLIVAGTGKDQQVLLIVDGVTPQSSDQRTLVSLVTGVAGLMPPASLVAQRYRAEAASRFQGSVLAGQAAKELSTLIDESKLLNPILRSVRQLHTTAMNRSLTRLGAWFSNLLDDLGASINASPAKEEAAPERNAGKSSEFALGNLNAIVGKLALAPSIPPASSISLPRTITASFGAQSDTAPRLLAAFNPAAAPTLYQAWADLTPAPIDIKVYAARIKAGLFANNFAGIPSVTQKEVREGALTTTTTTTFTAPTLGDAVYDLIVGNTLTELPLDGVYGQIAVGSWVAITRPALDANDKAVRETTTYHRVQSVRTASRETVNTADNSPTGYAAKVTQLALDPPWLSDMDPRDFQSALRQTSLLRGTVIYAQAEELALAEEPLDRDVLGSSIELDGLYKGLQAGRWAIVSGNRTDISGTTGVLGTELVMIAGVQETQAVSDTVHTTLTLASPLAYTYDASTVTIYGNVAEATNGQSVGEVLGNGDTSQVFQSFPLHQKPLTYLSAATPVGAQSTLTVTVNEIEWQETDDLSALGPKDHVYTTQTDNSGQTTVIFGNGVNGARVSTGTANVKAVYRYGIGSGANVDAQQISQLATQPGGIQSVINPSPATGGADADSLSQARVNTPLAVKALDRLVSVQDYADFSRSYAGIGKAASVKLSNGRRQVVFVTIAGAGDIPIATSSDLYNNLVQALQQFGDPHQPILVGVRKAKLVVIAAGIAVLAGYQFEDVEPNVRTSLLDTFSFENRNLGRTAFLSEAISTMQAVQGVAFVNVTVFDSVSQDATAAALASLGTTLIRRGHVTAKPAYVDKSLTPPANPTAQDYFQIQPAELVYLTPDIPDTLILTQITSANPGPAPSLPNKRAKKRRTRRAGGMQ